MQQTVESLGALERRIDLTVPAEAIAASDAVSELLMPSWPLPSGSAVGTAGHSSASKEKLWPPSSLRARWVDTAAISTPAPFGARPTTRWGHE